MTDQANKKPDINLKQYKRFERKFPWGLIRKIISFTVFALGIFYGSKYLEKHMSSAPKQENSDGIEVEFEIPNEDTLITNENEVLSIRF